jgi:hypothetical protein
MNARSLRGILTTNNIAEAVDDDPGAVIELIQDIIDNPDYDIPDAEVSSENVIRLMELQSYYTNQYPYLVGLWGSLRYQTERTDNVRVALRDHLEKAVSACSKKYEAASRMLTGIQVVQNESRESRKY